MLRKLTFAIVIGVCLSLVVTCTGILISTNVVAQSVNTSQLADAHLSSKRKQIFATNGLTSRLELQIAAVRDQFKSIANGASAFPEEMARIIDMVQDEIRHDNIRVAPLLILFLSLGLGAQSGGTLFASPLCQSC